MTCIVGTVQTDGSILLGADSAASDGFSMQNLRTRKLWRVPCGTHVAGVGFTTSWRFGQLLRGLSLGEPGADLEEWAIESVVPAMRTAMKDGGYTSVHEGRETAGTMLFAIGGRLFSIWEDFSVLERRDPFDSVGSGSYTARGALAALQLYKEGKPLLRAALRIASEQIATVRGPFEFIEVPA